MPLTVTLFISVLSLNNAIGVTPDGHWSLVTSSLVTSDHLEWPTIALNSDKTSINSTTVQGIYFTPFRRSEHRQSNIPLVTSIDVTDSRSSDAHRGERQKVSGKRCYADDADHQDIKICGLLPRSYSGSYRLIIERCSLYYGLDKEQWWLATCKNSNTNSSNKQKKALHFV